MIKTTESKVLPGDLVAYGIPGCADEEFAPIEFWIVLATRTKFNQTIILFGRDGAVLSLDAQPSRQVFVYSRTS